MNNILIVDDNAYLLDALVLRIGIHLQDWNILTARDGKEGVDILNSTQVDIILTDLQMPVLDGFGLIEHRNKKFPHVPVFVMTALCAPEIQNTLKTMRVIECIEKPFDFEKLTDKIVHAMHTELTDVA